MAIILIKAGQTPAQKDEQYYKTDTNKTGETKLRRFI